VDIFFYPKYVNIQTTTGLSPWLFNELEKRTIALQEQYWDGEAESLMQINRPSIIRASSVMKSTKENVAIVCAHKGHFLFYDDNHITTTGSFSGDKAKHALCEWLNKNT
jgi:hypothetical protein